MGTAYSPWRGLLTINIHRTIVACEVVCVLEAPSAVAQERELDESPPPSERAPPPPG